MDGSGAAAADHPAWVIRFHLGDRSASGVGRFEVRRGHTRPARAVGALLRLPRPGSDVAVRVQIRRSAQGELWVRTFDRRDYVSRQVCDGVFAVERIGPLELRFRRLVEGVDVSFEQEAASIRVAALRVRLPDRFAPRVRARAHGNGEGRFFVRVDVTVPGLGPLLSYWGDVYEQP